MLAQVPHPMMPPASLMPTSAGMNGSMGSPTVSSYGQPTPGMSSVMPTSQQMSSGNQPTPEEKLTSRQQRKKQELLDHKAAGEQNLEREEKLEISGKDARYMMMQKLARGAPVGFLSIVEAQPYASLDAMAPFQ